MADLLKQLYEINDDGELRLKLHHGQALTWMSKRRLILMLAGTQSGKTSFGPWWLYREIYGMGDHAGLGAGDYIAATTTHKLFDKKMLPEMMRVLVDTMQVGKYHAGRQVMELKNPETGRFSDNPYMMWGRIILMSAASPDALEAATAKAAWLDEVGQGGWDVTLFEAIMRRLSLHEGRLLGTTTIYNSGWLKSEWYDRWVEGDPDYDVIQFGSAMNPNFSEKEFRRAKRTLPDWRFKMFYLGEFSQPAGLVYPDFDDGPNGTMVDDFEVPLHWPIYIGVDFGGVNGATVYFAEDIDNPTPEGNVFYAYDDYLEGNVAIKVLVDRTIERIGNRETYYLTGGAASESDYRREWATHGLYISQPDITSVEVGILATTGLLRTGRLKVFRSRKGIRSEFVSYMRKVDKQGQILDIIENKAMFHRMDAIRYFALLAGEGGPQIF